MDDDFKHFFAVLDETYRPEQWYSPSEACFDFSPPPKPLAHWHMQFTATARFKPFARVKRVPANDP